MFSMGSYLSEDDSTRSPKLNKSEKKNWSSSEMIVTATQDMASQIREHRERHRRKFHGATHDNSEGPDVIFSHVVPGAPISPFMNDEELARKLAAEDEDAALAQAIRLSEEINVDDEIFILSDFGESSSSNQAHVRGYDNLSESSLKATASSSNHSSASIPAMRSNLFQHKEADSGFTATFNIMERLDKNLKADPSVNRFRLSADCFHIASIAEDLGNWSCGYRNAQLLISSFPSFPTLRDHLQNKLQSVYIPSILCLQNLIKKSWDNGWDPLGSKEHRYGIISSKNWIGPVDLYSMFMFLGIECKIISFVRREKCAGPHSKLFEWCANYFIDSTDKLPLYLQHAGHSRSVVGWEEKKNNQQYLLVSDPGTTKERMRWSGDDSKWTSQNFRKSISAMHHECYEMLYLTGRILSPYEQEKVKAADAHNGLRGETFVS